MSISRCFVRCVRCGALKHFREQLCLLSRFCSCSLLILRKTEINKNRGDGHAGTQRARLDGGSVAKDLCATRCAQFYYYPKLSDIFHANADKRYGRALLSPKTVPIETRGNRRADRISATQFSQLQLELRRDCCRPARNAFIRKLKTNANELGAGAGEHSHATVPQIHAID